MTILTPVSAAAMLHLKVRTIVALCAQGRLPARKVGRVWRIPLDSLEAK